MKKSAVALLTLSILVPALAQAIHVCTDDTGKTSYQDRPCPEKQASTTNLPVRASELSDNNSIETVARFYKAMSERDPGAASRFLADTFTSEVRRRNKPPVTDDKTSMTAALHQVLSAAKAYSAISSCRVAARTAAAYLLYCQVDEEGIVMDRSHRSTSDQTITVVLNSGFVKIEKIVSQSRD